mmetsp:Transcript_22127/g.53083  ORF Transcript_22127/g.53083 Transcript_22127/m.53083 type:complete len:280 (-) Transcript_22127:123-962(-)
MGKDECRAPQEGGQYGRKVLPTARPRQHREQGASSGCDVYHLRVRPRWGLHGVGLQPRLLQGLHQDVDDNREEEDVSRLPLTPRPPQPQAVGLLHRSHQQAVLCLPARTCAQAARQVAGRCCGCCCCCFLFLGHRRRRRTRLLGQDGRRRAANRTGSGCLLPLDRRVRGNRRPSQRRLQVRHREASLPRRVQVLQRDVPCTTAGGTRVELHGGWHQVHGHRMREPTALVPEALDEQPQGLLGQGQARLVQRRDHLRWILFHRRLLFQPPYVALLSQSST